MCVNTELMLETNDEKTVAAMEVWFDREWESRLRPDVKVLFDAYCKRHKQPHPNEGDRGGAPSPALHFQPQSAPPRSTRNGRPVKIVFRSNGKGAKGYEGIYRVVTPPGQPDEEIPYASHVEAVERIVGRLTREWQNLSTLERIEREGYKINDKPLLSSREDGTYEKPTGPARGKKPHRVGDGRWWICHDTSSEQKRDFICSVAKICEVDVEWDDKSTRGF